MKTSSLIVAMLLSLACTRPVVAREVQSRADAPAQVSKFDHTHALWTDVLKAHVLDDGFEYKKLAQDRSKLDAYLKQLESVSADEVASWTREQQFAYWIDAYNAFTIDTVLSKYPVESIKEIGNVLTSVWNRKTIPLKALNPEGKDEKLSLDDIENKILRPRFKDARAHSAINCASKGCPPLRAEAFVAVRLNDQLQDQARRWLADPSRNRFDRSANKVEISKIFDWFKDDFVREAGSVQAWLAKYAPPVEAAWLGSAKELKIDYFDYSWKLNEARE